VTNRKILTVYRRILCEVCVGRTSLYICAQQKSSGGGNMSIVHKRSTCSTYWRMVPLQKGVKDIEEEEKSFRQCNIFCCFFILLSNMLLVMAVRDPLRGNNSDHNRWSPVFYLWQSKCSLTDHTGQRHLYTYTIYCCKLVKSCCKYGYSNTHSGRICQISCC
jgi:hypothetical protein